MREKIGVVGAGHVGAEVVNELVRKDLGDCVLIDIIEGMPQGKALDMWEGTPIRQTSSSIEGTNDYSALKGSKVVVITAGVPRKPGMSREDLLKTNLDIMKSITREVKKNAPDSIVIIVTNPLDAMTYTFYKLSGFPRERVMGMAGILDSSRFRSFIALELGVSPEDIQAMVLGSHGDLMVPLPRYASVSGIPVTELISKDKIDAMVKRTQSAGGEIVKLLKTGSAYYSPGAAVALMVDAIVRDKKRILPNCALLKGEYGIQDIFVGVPVILGYNGIVKVLELSLTDDEKNALKQSADHVKKLQEEIDELLR